MPNTRPVNYPPIVDDDWFVIHADAPRVKRTHMCMAKSDVEIVRLSAGYIQNGAIYKWQEESYGVVFHDGTINHRFATSDYDAAKQAAQTWDIGNKQYGCYIRHLTEFAGFKIEFLSRNFATIRDDLSIFQVQWLVRERSDQCDFIGSYVISVLDSRGVQLLGSNQHVFADFESHCLNLICQHIGSKICEYTGSWQHSASLELCIELFESINQYNTMRDLKPLPKLPRPQMTFLDRVARDECTIDQAIEYFETSDRSHEGWIPMGFTSEEWQSWNNIETTKAFITRIVQARRKAALSS